MESDSDAAAGKGLVADLQLQDACWVKYLAAAAGLADAGGMVDGGGGCLMPAELLAGGTTEAQKLERALALTAQGKRPTRGPETERRGGILAHRDGEWEKRNSMGADQS